MTAPADKPDDALAVAVCEEFHDGHVKWRDAGEASRAGWRRIVGIVREKLGVTTATPTPIAKPSPASDLPREADKFARFVAGLDLRALSIADQREARERVHALMRALRGGNVL